MSEEQDAPDSQADETAKTAGRGFLVITVAKVWFLITGATIQLGLPIFFDSAELFGVFKIITEAISLLNMVVIVGTTQAVSKLVSEDASRANAMVKLALKLQFGIGLPLAVFYALGSPAIAASLNDPSLTGLLRLSSLIILFYSFYAIFVGYFNGLKEFVKQATLDISFATLKTVGILGLVFLGFGVWGAVAGFVAAAGLIMVASGVWTFRIMARRDEAPIADDGSLKASMKRLLGYLVVVMLYTFALNGLMRADLFVLKAVAADLPGHLTGADAVFKVISDKFAGFYGAVLNIARIPYQGVIAVTFVIFPLISEATFNDDLDTTRSYIRTTFRYCILLIASVALVLTFNSDSLIAGLYSTDYQAASIALAYLSVSIIFFALFYVSTTMMIGSGHPIAAVVVMGFSLLVSAILNYVMVSGFHEVTVAGFSWTPFEAPETTDPRLAVSGAIDVARNRVDLAGPYLVQAPLYMERAAIATTIAMVTGCLASIAWLGKTFGAWPPISTTIRVLIAAGALFGLDMVFPTPVEWVAEYGKLMYLAIVVGKMAVMGIALIIVLVVTGEFGKEDLDRVKAVIGRKSKS